ncbi:hypothetical protein WLF18_22980 [Pseudomonas shirazensis]|uniref:Oligosaccharide repeat unit polymerase n=1 Tax=Pseudomonas shirazensis TaxID=2745494 RepID=A0ABU9A5U7_9PSED
MSDVEFFNFAFSHMPLLLVCMGSVSFVLYLSIRRKVVLGYLDPLHFYWTFTFGTGYGVVLALYLEDFISFYYLCLVAGYALVFITIFSLSKRRGWWLYRAVKTLLVPRGAGRFEFMFIFFIYLALAFFLMFNTGLGVSADTNRFEQNRGVGAFVRVADGLRLFVLSYLTLICCRRWSAGQRGVVTWTCIGTYFVLLIVSSLLNGAKFAVLEGLYTSLFAVAVQGYRMRVSVAKVAIMLAAVLFFAVWVLGKNLEQSGIDSESSGAYMSDTPVLYERLALRILANGDKYYLSLPNGVIERLKTDSALIQFLSPLVSVTKMSELVGHPVNDYTVGRQSLLYWYPDYNTAGGPTSHFDLFSYKYLGLLPGILFVALIGFLLGSIVNVSRRKAQGPFYAALCATLWLRAIAMLLEPTVGLAYVLDIFIMFFVIKVFGMMLRAATSPNQRVGV